MRISPLSKANSKEKENACRMKHVLLTVHKRLRAVSNGVQGNSRFHTLRVDKFMVENLLSVQR
jgi:hypothetical protein